jgi:hypothetical protein
LHSATPRIYWRRMNRGRLRLPPSVIYFLTLTPSSMTPYAETLPEPAPPLPLAQAPRINTIASAAKKILNTLYLLVGKGYLPF